MTTLLLAVLIALAFKIQVEGTCRIESTLGSRLFARFGKFKLGLVTCRPGRVYYRMGVT